MRVHVPEIALVDVAPHVRAGVLVVVRVPARIPVAVHVASFVCWDVPMVVIVLFMLNLNIQYCRAI